ncbi:hypothetical protein [Bacteriovorax sp. Seq25_V]|uniref:hypothetical protein n=1 Tax=Bacteriovorax sp. Seq25_V TaxID=1201288 RepID=UPI00038A2C80|nr:hypothetical protein [Bacteriovorax sp. Seq25_V]EQC46853.1 putative membrane protein [Bacteriovorax sp. Seq25_V]
MKKSTILKYHLEIIVVVLLVFFGLFLNYFDPFVNDLYILQANAILNGKLDIVSASSDLLIFDSTIYKNSIYMSWGLLPAFEYIIFSKLTFGMLSPSVLFYIHLGLIPILLKKISESSSLGYIALISPFFLYFFKQDVVAVDLSFIFGLSYFLASIYARKKEKHYIGAIGIIASALCRFGFLPILISYLLIDSLRFKKYFLNLLTIVVAVGSVLYVNYLKFENFLFWGERFNKFQGEWITILKTLQVDSFSLSRIGYSFIDFVRGVFLNFGGEIVYGNSLAISQLNSILIYIFIGALVYMLLSKLLEVKLCDTSMLLLFFVDILFQIIFVRFYSFRLLFISFILLFLSFEIRIKKDKFSLLAMICCFLFLIILNDSIGTRHNKLDTLQNRDEVHSYDYSDKTEYLCEDVKSALRRDRQVFDSLFTGFVIENERCYAKNPFSILVNKEKKRCLLEIDLKDITCDKLWLKSIAGDNIFKEENGVCSAIIESDYIGELLLYLIYDFENQIVGQNIYMNKSKSEFIRLNLDCVNEY